MLILQKFKKYKENIKLTNLILIWYVLTCTICISAGEYIFSKYIFILHTQTEKNTVESNLPELLKLIDRHEKTKKNFFEDVYFFLDQKENIYISIENLTDHKIIYITPKMHEFIDSFKKNGKPLVPDKELSIRENNSKYYYYIEKNITHNGKSLRIEIFTEKTKKILLMRENRNNIAIISYSVLFICLFISILILKIILNPVNQIVKKISNITSLNLHERIETKWLPHELLIIKNSFNNVLERLEDSFLRVTQFSDDIAHEIRTPVNILKGEIEVTLQRERSTKEYKDTLYSSLEECHRLSQIIDNLTFLSRSEKKNIQIQPQNTNIYEELSNIKELYEPVAEEKSVSISISCNQELIAYVDKVLFQRIISNLVSNAVNYNKINGKVLIKTDLSKGFLNIEIIDTGIGISEKNLPYIFDRFYMIEKSRNNESKNLGLGLAMVKGMVELHNGFIEFKSKENEGTTVHIKLKT